MCLFSKNTYIPERDPITRS